jgi:Mg-chelatase subunit ChlD
MAELVGFVHYTSIVFSASVDNDLIRNFPLLIYPILIHKPINMNTFRFKQLVLTIQILIVTVGIYSQNNISTIKTANEHIQFINELTGNLITTQNCLYTLYSDLERGRNPKYNNFIGSGYICTKFITENQFNTLLENTKNLPANKALELNSNAQLLYDIFLKINQLCRELEIYIRLKDYTKDRLKKSDEIYQQISVNYNIYIQQKEKYYQSVLNLAGTFSNDQVYSKLIEYLDGEQNLVAQFKLNFQVNTFTSNVPVDNLLQQIKASDNLLANIQIHESNELYSLKGIVDVAKSQLQRVKRDAIDNYSAEAKKSDAYANNFMHSYLIYLNDYLISDYNRYVTNSSRNLLLYPKSILSFKIDSTEKEYVTKKFTYLAKEIPALNVKKQSIVIPVKTINALNNYIEFINEELRINYDFARGLYMLNKSANKQLESNADKFYLSFSYYDGYALPTASYDKTINESQYISKEYSNVLNPLLKELYDIITEKYQLMIEMEEYVNTKKYQKDKHVHLYEMLERFEYLMDMFDKRKQELYENTRQISESYLPVSNNAWTTGGAEMLKLMDKNYLAYRELKEQNYSEKYGKVSASAISEKARELLIKEYDNLKGLQKFGRNHGRCPYNPYEDIAGTSVTFAENIDKFPNMERIKRDWPGYYYDFIYLYNNLVDDYNNFVDLAAGGYEEFKSHKTKEVLLLKNVKQQVYFKLEKPTISNEKPKDEPIKEKPLQKEPEIKMEGFAANNLVLLLDVSGSMKDNDKLPLLRESFLKVLPYLRAEDEISIVVFSGKGDVLLSPISCSEKEKIAEVLKSLESSGYSNFDKGLKLAYKVAKSNFKTNANNRIIIATDGAYAIDDELYKMAEKESDKDVYLSVFSFGNKGNVVRSLDKLANNGKGNYEIIEESNAVKKLVNELQALKLK